MKVNCANCGLEINRNPSVIRRSKTGNVYCSRSCSNSMNNTLFKVGENHPNFKHGNSTYREKKLKYTKEHKCEICEEDDICVLQVHHIDGNRKNNSIENLKLLCANCHLREHCNCN